MKVTDCPKRCLDADLVQAIRYSEFISEGLPPVAGGALDQSAWFMNFHAIYESEASQAQAERYKK